MLMKCSYFIKNIKKIVLVLVLTSIFSLIVAESFIPFSYEGKIGLLNSDSEILLSPKYDSLMPILNTNYYIGNIRNNYFIFENNSIVFSTKTSKLSHIYEDWFYHESGNCIVNIKNNKTLYGINFISTESPFIPSRISPNDGKYYYRTLDGEIIFNINGYFRVYGFYENYSVILDNDWNFNIIDTFGTMLLNNIEIDLLGQRVSENLIPVLTINGKTGYISPFGDFMLDISFECCDGIIGATDFVDGYACILINQNPFTWVVINKDGKVVSNPIYAKSLTSFSNGYSLAYIEKNQYNFVDVQGNFISEINFESATKFYNGYAQIIQNGKEGLISTSGEITWCEELF